MAKVLRLEILVGGVVQGVGFRYYVAQEADALGVRGFTQNLPSGEVLTIAEGEDYVLREFFERVKVGSRHSSVQRYSVKWSEATNEFLNFFIRR